MDRIDFFVKHWGSRQSMIPIKDTDIEEFEVSLNIKLPESYKYLINTYGLIHTPNVLTKVCELGVDVSEVQDFLSLDDIASLSKLYELMGMPQGHILFASDCKGNMFCFKQSDCQNLMLDIPVYFYERDSNIITAISDSFIGWLDAFNHLS